jgi:hypothetical protein
MDARDGKPTEVHSPRGSLNNEVQARLSPTSPRTLPIFTFPSFPSPLLLWITIYTPTLPVYIHIGYYNANKKIDQLIASYE